MRSSSMALFLVGACLVLAPAGAARASGGADEVVRGNARAEALFSRTGRTRWKSFRAELRDALAPEVWKALKRGAWEPYPMRERWVGEDTQDHKRVQYLRTDAERAPFRVTLRDGVLYDAKDRPLEASAKSYLVEDDRGILYARDYADYKKSAKKTHLKFKHSSFNAGGTLSMATEPELVDGRFTYVKNRSGHYHPGKVDFVRWLLALERRGVDLAKTEIEFDDKSELDGPSR